MRQTDPAARALSAALFLAFAGSVVLVVLQSFPLAALLPDGWPDAGPEATALLAYLGIAAVQGVIWAVLLGLLPIAALPPAASRAARLAAQLAGLAVALALASGTVAGLAPGLAATLPVAAIPLLMIVPHLALATALALRLPGPGRRNAGLAATAAAGALAAAYPQTAIGLLPLMVAILAMAAMALRGRDSSGLARACALALAAAWLLPLAADALPRLAEALAVPAPGERLAALGAAFATLRGPAQAYHPAGTVLALGILAGLRAPGTTLRGAAWLAGLLASTVALPEVGLALDVVPLDPSSAIVAVRSDFLGPTAGAAAVVFWVAQWSAAPLMALTAGLMFLRVPRRP
ncbi:MAG: hypothetical protein MUE98_12525 [Rhodobacteraceae bacterium]|nr:hypothetical protein [Paracoccaceae bacterium]